MASLDFLISSQYFGLGKEYRVCCSSFQLFTFGGILVVLLEVTNSFSGKIWGCSTKVVPEAKPIHLCVPSLDRTGDDSEWPLGCPGSPRCVARSSAVGLGKSVLGRSP